MSRKHPSGVFMMEMIAVVFFFILCAGICINTFAKADVMSREAADLNQSVFIAQSVAEIWKADGAEGFEEKFQSYGLKTDLDSYAMGFDLSGNPCDIEHAAFHVTAEIAGQEQAEVIVGKNGIRVYTLTVKRHARQQ